MLSVSVKTVVDAVFFDMRLIRLPASLRQPDIEFEQFKCLFKHISVWQDHGALVTKDFNCTMYKCIYLFTYAHHCQYGTCCQHAVCSPRALV